MRGQNRGFRMKEKLNDEKESNQDYPSHYSVVNAPRIAVDFVRPAADE